MHIALFSLNYVPHPGGIEVVVDELARELGQRHQVTIVTSDWEAARGVTRAGGVTTWRVPALHVTERFGVPYPVPRSLDLRAALRDASSADLFHAHGALYVHTLLAARLARRHQRPFVLTEHVGFVDYPSRVTNAVQRAAWNSIGNWTVAQADAITTYNARVQAWLSTRYPGRAVRFIANGVDLERFRPLDPDARLRARVALGLPVDDTIVLFVGRATAKKNFDHVLNIPRDGFTLVTCGARRDLSLAGVVDLGQVPNERMSLVYSCADIMVHAATGEGFPLAVQEAMATAVPVVLRWDPGYAGMLDRAAVLACDTPGEIADAVGQLVASPECRALLGTTGERWARGAWSWKSTVQSFEQLYAEVRGAYHADPEFHERS